MKKEGEAVVEGEVQKSPEQLAAEEKEAEAAFTAGVDMTLKQEHTEPEKKEEAGATTITDDEATKADATAKAAADAETKRVADEKAKADAAAADPWKDVPAVVREQFKKLEKLPEQMDNLAGHIGGFKRSLDSITATATAAAAKKNEDAPTPTKIQVAEAMSDPDKWKQLQEDFPEWMGPVFTALTELRKDMVAVAKGAQAAIDKPAPAAAAPAQVEPVDVDAITASAEERAYVRLKHPDWKAICATPEFTGWLDKAPADIKALAASEAGDDAVKLFDTYKDHRKKLADQAAEKAKNDKRLEGALTPNGSGEPPQTGISDEDAFNKGVKKTLKGAK